MARFRIVLRVGALLLALGFLAALVGSQWQVIQNYTWSLQPGWAALSFIGLGLAWLLELSIWRLLLASLGGRLTAGRAAQAWFLSNIVRYIPGNVWQFLGMAELAADDGVSRIGVLASILLHQALSTVAGLVLAALYFAVAPGQNLWLGQVRPLLWLAPLALLLCHPRLLEWGLNQLLRRLKRPLLRVTLTWRQVWLALLGYLGVWLLMGGGFALLATALAPVAPAWWPSLAAIWAAAYVIGYLSLLTPSGLGVREGVMVLLLTPLLPPPAPTLIALAARLWMIAGEVVGAGVALLARSRSRPAPPHKAAPPADALLTPGGRRTREGRP